MAVRKQPRILIVDDSKMMRLVARDAMEEIGLEVVEAPNGERAISTFNDQQPDIVLLDLNMPRLDGFAVCELIRLHAEGVNTPVLMMTAADDLDLVRRAYEVGATDFATKPINYTPTAGDGWYIKGGATNAWV